MSIKPLDLRDYLGDGVYVDYDGYHIILIANDPNTGERIYLEPQVLEALERYIERIREG